MKLEYFSDFTNWVESDSGERFLLEDWDIYEYYGRNKDALLIVGTLESIGDVFLAVDVSMGKQDLYNILTYTIGNKRKTMDAYNGYKERHGWMMENKKGVKRLNINDIDSIDTSSPLMQTWFALSSESFIKNLERALKDVAYVIGEESSAEFFETIIVESNDIGLRFFYNFDLEDETIEVMTHGTASSRYEKNVIDVVPFSKINFTEKGVIDFINKETRDILEGRYNESRKGVKRMKKLTERTDDYEDLLKQYGNDYLEELGYDEDKLYSMWEFDDMLSGIDPFDIAIMVFYGGTYEGDKGQSFNTNCEYFTYQGDGNLLGVFEYSLKSYYEDYFSYDDFIEWCKEQGYVDDDDDF